MDLPSLESLAEVSVTLAGFAAVFRAFATGTDPDGYSAVRLNIVIEGGLVLAFLCFLPTVFHTASIPEDGALRVSSGLGATWLFFRATIPGIRIIGAGWPPPSGLSTCIQFFARRFGFICGRLSRRRAFERSSSSCCGGPVRPDRVHLRCSVQG